MKISEETKNGLLFLLGILLTLLFMWILSHFWYDFSIDYAYEMMRN